MPPVEYMFLMKLLASRPGTDHSDMAQLLAHCRWTTVREVVDAYYDAYPAEERDPYLGAFIRERATVAGVDLADPAEQ